jgi:septal ring factor EnvC (AmiA/AmiB activator)
VQLALPGAKESWMPELDAWLAYRGFAAVTERPGTWQRDPLATALLLLRQRDLQVLNLTQKQAELISQRDAAQTLEAELISQRDAAQTLEADLIAQRDAAQTLEAELIAQRDAAKTLEAELITQRDAAQTIEAELISQRDGLGARAEQLQGGLDWLLGEIAQLRFLVDQAVAHDPTAIPEIAVPAPAESA